ncbi:unnamed protein product [Alopecurus aequalis]
MSWSSSTSAAPGFRRASGRSGVDARSPVRYREDAMAYETAKYCRCRCEPRRKAPRWISWSRQNPGRRYYACMDALHGGCGYVEWHDVELPQFFSDLIGDLRDEVRRLKGQGNVGQDHQEAAMVDPNEDATTLMLVSVQDDLRKKNAEIAAMKAKFDNLVFLCIVFVLGLVAGKMLM